MPYGMESVYKEHIDNIAIIEQAERKMDEELKRAMEQGEILSLGETSSELPSNITAEVLEDLNLSALQIKYNFPIGIDFTKHISPPIYLSSLTLIRKMLAIPFLSTEYHYEIESLLLLLTQGKINRYRSSLKSYTLSRNLDSDEDLSKDQQSLIISHILTFLLSIASEHEEDWPIFSELNAFFQKKQTNPACHLEPKQTEKYSSENVIHHLVINTLLGQIITRPLDPAQVTAWIQIKRKINSFSYTAAVEQIRLFFDPSITAHLSNITQLFSSHSQTLSSQELEPLKKSLNIFLLEVLQCLGLLLNQN